MLLFGQLILSIAANAQQTLPPGPGKQIVQQQCAGCHAVRVVTAKRASKQQWSALVDQMITRGANLEDEDIDTVVDYLSRNFGPGRPPAPDKSTRKASLHINTATATQISAGLGLTAKQSAAIVAYRKQNGDFKNWQELSSVPGIDAAKIESKKDLLIF